MRGKFLKLSQDTALISVALALLSWTVPTALADVAGLVEVIGSLDNPVFVTHAPGDRERLFIVEESGRIKIFNFSTGLNGTPFLTIPNVDTESEGGLLGLAFHPQYSTSGAPGEGKFYVYATIDPNDNDTAPEPFLSHIREYTVSANPDVANPTPKEMLSFLQPQANHNGGWIGFSPIDNYLYINFGDGGGSDDNDAGHTAGTGNAQDTSNLLGKTLRIDVNGDDFPLEPLRNYAIPSTNPLVNQDGADEIWAYGLRNPFRASFDRLTGDLWIGDVGQSNREEIDYRPFDRTEVANYGWRLREGDIETPTPEDDPVGGDEPEHYVPPVYAYERGTDDFEGFTVIGGYVYRGPDPDLQGLYFFADAGSRHVWTFDPVDIAGTRANIDGDLGPVYSQLGQPVSFGEDAKGNLYIVDYGSQTSATGQVFRIVTDSLLAGDYDADGKVDLLDYKEWKEAYGTSLALADGNKDGMVTAADYTIWRNNLGNSVHNLGAGAGGAVPEPASIVLLWQVLLLGSAAAFHRRRRGV
jgi:glucose/arabinose dehydrogenase